MSLIKNYFQQTQEIEEELALIDDELYLSMLETQMSDWSYILNDDNSNAYTNSEPTVGSTRSM